MIYFLIFLLCIAEEGEPPGETYERTGRMKALYSWVKDCLVSPTSRGYGLKHFEASQKLCAKGVN